MAVTATDLSLVGYANGRALYILPTADAFFGTVIQPNGVESKYFNTTLCPDLRAGDVIIVLGGSLTVPTSLDLICITKIDASSASVLNATGSAVAGGHD